jgi:hypothetical protein
VERLAGRRRWRARPWSSEPHRSTRRRRWRGRLSATRGSRWSRLGCSGARRRHQELQERGLHAEGGGDLDAEHGRTQRGRGDRPARRRWRWRWSSWTWSAERVGGDHTFRTRRRRQPIESQTLNCHRIAKKRRRRRPTNRKRLIATKRLI